MNDRQRRTVTQRVRAILGQESEGEAPDRLLEAVFARTQGSRQSRRRPWDGMAGLPQAPSPPQRLLAGAVVAVLAGVLLLPLLGSGSGPARPPGPAQSPSVAAPMAVGCGGGRGLAGDASGLWLACASGIERFERSGGALLAPVRLGDVGLPAIGPAGSFAASGTGISRISETGELEELAELPGVTLLAVGTARVYAADAFQRLSALDPASGRVLASVVLGAAPLALVATPDGIWVATADGRVRRRDLLSLSVTADVGVAGRPIRLAASSRALYALGIDDGGIARIDLATLAVVRGNVGDAADPGTLDLLVANDAGVWISRRTALVAIDPARLLVGRQVLLPDYPAGIVLDPDHAWVAGSTGRIDQIALPGLLLTP